MFWARVSAYKKGFTVFLMGKGLTFYIASPEYHNPIAHLNLN
jgi:hypothetical protein